MDADLIALRDEIDARLVEVEHSRGTCSGHPALARAIATLLGASARNSTNGRPARLPRPRPAGWSVRSWLALLGGKGLGEGVRGG
jgi:hypothetical protein